MNKTLLIVIILAITGIAAFIIYESYFNKLKSLMNKQAELPEEYKAYKYFSANFETEKYETILLFKSENYSAPRPIRLYNSINNQVIAAIDRDEKEFEPGKYYYKLDFLGNKIDSLYAPRVWANRDVGFFGEYFVNVTDEKNYFYTTWPLNGDTTHKIINIINKDLSWSIDKVEDFYNDITADAKFIFYDGDEKTDEKNGKWQLNKVFYFKDKKWSVLYRKMKTYTYLDPKVYSSINEFYYTSDDPENNDAENQKNYQIKYFDKKEYISYEHSIGGGSPSFSKRGWVGTLYFDFIFNGDQLKLKQDGIIVETEKNGENYYYRSHGEGESVSPFKLNIYTNKTFKFALFSKNLYSLYIVKAKDNKN
ncbi:hypothetical protein [Pedobacter nototheniae]|uniref:hypothetical protein n=1 Tax=Pedobacter nototheniae TaxID=2488994 RepID=UPI00103DD3AB|nr:hypothetical protein [Pedobacter nototheniae]